MPLVILGVTYLRLERIRGRKSKALRDIADVPLILEFKNKRVYGGNLDDYEDGCIWLYNCKRLDKRKKEWVNHGIMIEFEGKIIEDCMPGFRLSEIKDIYTLSKEDEDKWWLGLDNVLQFYIDPHHKPLRGVNCRWGPDEKHAAECDAKLHEALSIMLTYCEASENKETHQKIHDAFTYIRRRLIMYGAKIP